MALIYTPLRHKSTFMPALKGDPKKISDFNIVYSTVGTIDLQNFILRYNALEYSGNVTDLTNLRNDIDTAISVIDSLKHSYKDVDVLAPANEMKMRLSTVRSATESRIRHYNSRLAKTKVGQAIDKTKKGMNKVVKAYKKITGPADKLFNAAQNAADGGGANIYEQIGKFGRRK